MPYLFLIFFLNPCYNKELEQLLSRQEEANTVARVMQSKLAKFRELEKEIEKLKEDNHYYRYIVGAVRL